MSPLRTRAVNRELADHTEEWGARRREDTLRVAAWRLDGGGPADPALMVRAARQARFLFDFPLAERLARVAAEGDDPEAGQVLAEVLAQQGKLADAEAFMATLEPRVSDDQHRALVSMTRCDNLFWGIQDEERAFAVSRQAEAAVTSQEWQDEIVCQRASFDLLAGRSEYALATVADFLERPLSRALIGAAVVAGPALAIAGRSDEALLVCERALAAHRHLGDQLMITHPGIHLVARSLALVEAGRLAEAEGNAQLGYDGSVATGAVRAQSWFALMLGRAALMQGKVLGAARWGREAASLYREVGRTGPVRWCMGLVAMAEAMAGDAVAAEAALAEADELIDTPFQLFAAEIERARAWVLVARGELSAARALLQVAATMAGASGQLSIEASALHDLVRTGDEGAAAAAARLAELALVVDGELTKARAAHAAALQHDDAGELETVAGRFEAMGAMLLAAEVATAAAVTARRHGQRATAMTCGRLAAALTARCDGARTPGLAVAAAEAALTAREREIAMLAASGLSSSEIAERLGGVSVRTVTNHLQRAYAKLGVSRRGELAGALEG
jgi:DNA-binding CsgD family transcriptional regulator